MWRKISLVWLVAFWPFVALTGWNIHGVVFGLILTGIIGLDEALD